MNISTAKTLLIALLCLFPFLIHAQDRAYGPGAPAPWEYDSVPIQWSKAEWFGKSKVTLGRYASAKFRQGMSSTSNRVLVNGREELMQKTSFRVDLQDSTGAKFTLRGEKFWSSGYWEEDNGSLQLAGELLKLPEVLTESETYMADAIDLEISDAEMSHSLQQGDLWKFHLKRNRSNGAILEELDAYLSNGVRIISIRGPVGPEMPDPSAAGPEASYYEFMEDGKRIAWVSRMDSVVYFPSPIPSFTRSLLLTAILCFR